MCWQSPIFLMYVSPVQYVMNIENNIPVFGSCFLLFAQHDGQYGGDQRVVNTSCSHGMTRRAACQAPKHKAGWNDPSLIPSMPSLNKA